MIETTELYGGEVICEFNPARHTYTIINKGRRFKATSVTRICGTLDKPALLYWAVDLALDLCKAAIAPGTEYAETYLEAVWIAARRQAQDVKRQAADRGKEIHTAIQRSLQSGVDGQREDRVAEGVGQLLRDEQIRPLHVESKIYSRRFRYCGTYDCLGECPKGLVLLDWKTGKSLYPEYHLQTAAYAHAWEEEHPDQPIAGRYLVRIAGDGSIAEAPFFPRQTVRKDFAAFLGAKALFDRVQVIEKEARKAKKILLTDV